MSEKQRTTKIVTARREGSGLSQTLIKAVAAMTGDDPLDLTPLCDVIDPDALDSLLQSGTAGRVTFTYHECTVNVTADGQITVRG